MKPLIKSHVQKILLTGTNVVLDFPAERAAFDTEEMFHQVTQYFEVPAESEQLQVTVVSQYNDMQLHLLNTFKA